MGTGKTIVLVDGTAPPRFIPSTRFTLALLVCFAFIIQYSQRVNLPIAIVCMVNRTKPVSNQVLENVPAANSNNNLANSRNSMSYHQQSTTLKTITTTLQKKGFLTDKQFNWVEFQQQLLLGGYWAGYIFTQIPGGWLATSIGPKWVYATSLSVSSTATLASILMYWMSNTQFFVIFILRFIVGLAHGVLFPATISLWSVWAVPEERSTLASIGFCGTQFGTSLTMLLGGISCRYLASGWMYLFFITSMLGFVWLSLWVPLTSHSPTDHPRISNHERDYICSLTGHTGKKRPMTLSTIPWTNVIKSKPVLALLFTHIANLFGLFFFLTNLSKILTELHRVPTQYTGYILSFGFFLTLCTSLTSGVICDKLVRSKTMTLTAARRMFNSIASFVPVLCMISLSFCDESNKILGIITVLVFLAASGLGYGSGYSVNFADIVPAYSGIIFGIANTFASIAGLTGNLVAGILVKEPVLSQWRKLFIIFGTVYFVGGLVYLLFGSGVPRKWARFQSAAAVEEEKKDNAEELVPMNANDPAKA